MEVTFLQTQSNSYTDPEYVDDYCNQELDNTPHSPAAQPLCVCLLAVLVCSRHFFEWLVAAVIDFGHL